MTTTRYPARDRAEPILETPMMREARTRVFAVHHPRGQFVTWYGEAGVGKTTTGEWMEEQCNTDCEAGVTNAFRVARLTVPPSLTGYRAYNPGKKALLAIHNAVLPPKTDSEARWLGVASLAQMVVQQLATTDAQILMIDEAGRLDLPALEAVLLLLNYASDPRFDHPLTIVLIGMHELPINIEQLPQVKSRVADMITFRPYEVREAHELLRQVSPYFAGLDPASAEGKEALTFVIESTGGLVRSMLQLVEKATALAQEARRPMSVLALRAALKMSEEDQERAKEAVISGHRGRARQPGGGRGGARVARGGR